MNSYLKHWAMATAKAVAPEFYSRKKMGILANRMHEPELALLPALCDPAKLSIDIGAAEGLVSRRLLDHSSTVVAFEPRPAQAVELRAIFRAADSRIKIEQVALSNHAGETRLRVLTNDPGRSTIEPANVLLDDDGSPLKEIAVPLRTLDSYDFNDVGLIKIDVEGHEIPVLEGATRTIQSSRPNLLIEVEDRHKPGAIDAVFAFANSRAYDGYFLLDNKLCPIKSFSKEEHQKEANIAGWRENWKRLGTYVNNFVFIPREKSTPIETSLRRCLSRG